MSLSASAIFGIVTLIASISTSSAGAVASKRAGDEEDALAKEEARKQKERNDLVRKQQKRSTDIQGLERQLEKRRGAEKTARQVPGAQSMTRGKIEAPAAPVAPSAQQPAPAPKTGGISPSNLETIGSGIKAGAQVASGITAGVAASQQAKADAEERARLSKLEEEEFKKNLAAKTRNVNLQGLDLQDRAATGPTASARQNTFSSDFMSVLRNIKRQPRGVI